jgi:hypothetical protein
MANVPDLVVATYAQQPMQLARQSADVADWRELFRVVGWNAAGEPLGYLLSWSGPYDYRAGKLLIITWPGYRLTFDSAS